METTPRKIILTLWRDATVAALILYILLLILDALLNEFVEALVPVSAIGWLTVALILGWLYIVRSRENSCSTKT